MHGVREVDPPIAVGIEEREIAWAGIGGDSSFTGQSREHAEEQVAKEPNRIGKVKHAVLVRVTWDLEAAGYSHLKGAERPVSRSVG